MRQSITIASRERTEDVTIGLHRGNLSIVKYNHPLFYMHTQGIPLGVHLHETWQIYQLLRFTAVFF